MKRSRDIAAVLTVVTARWRSLAPARGEFHLGAARANCGRATAECGIAARP